MPLAEAQRRFEPLADAGSKDAEYMVASTINEIGNCLADLGRFDQAAEAYEETIRRNLGYEKRRTVAVARAQLGTVRLRQKRYEEALTAYVNARDTYEALGEPVGVATAWHLLERPTRTLATSRTANRHIAKHWQLACGRTMHTDKQPPWRN